MTSPAEVARILSGRGELAEELAEEREAARRAAAAEDRREALVFANDRLDDPMGEVSRCRAALGEAADEVADLEARLATARGKAGRARSNLEFFAGRLAIVTDAAERAAPLADPVTAAQGRARLAAERLAEELADGRALVARHRAQWQARTGAACAGCGYVSCRCGQGRQSPR